MYVELACRIKTDVFVLIIKLTEVWFSTIKHGKEKASRKKMLPLFKIMPSFSLVSWEIFPQEIKNHPPCLPILPPGVCLSVTITGTLEIRRQGLTVFF